MDDFILNILSPSLLCGVIFIIGGAIMYMYPPKNINPLYGYRTAASMQSKQRWDFAQKFSASLMIKIAVVMVVLSLMGYFIPVGEEITAIAGIALIIVHCVCLFIATEKALKKKFSGNAQ
jgi:uncharacterized membrane protein